MAEPTPPKVGPAGKPASSQEARRLAAYPPAPSSFLGAPAYALAVRKRQQALRAALADVNERLKKAEAERDGAEAQLGQASVDYGLITGHEAEQLKSKVAEAERSVSGARERKTQADEHYEREKVRLAEELQKVQAALEPYAGWRNELAAKLKQAEAGQSHGEVAAKRLEIELRNADQLVAKGADPQTAAKRKAELLAQRARLETEQRSATATLARVQTEADQLTAQLAPLERQKEELERQREALEREHDERVGAHSEQQKLASNWRRSRLAIIGRQVYDMDPRPKLLDAERLFGRIDQSRAKVGKVQEELELHLAALDAHDHRAVERARYVLYAGGAVLVLLLLALLLYAC